MRGVLVVNSGSSSLKYQLIDMDGESTVASGLIERIGSAGGRLTHRDRDAEPDVVERDVADHAVAFDAMLDAFADHGPDLTREPPVAIGHRVVHGASRYTGPTLVTAEVERGIDELSPLAPLHNPANLEGIRAASDTFPGVPEVAVFDTAFHQTIPEAAYTYALDREVASRHLVRRYGFHGTSHKIVSERAAAFLGIPLERSRIIVLHLGNGASACAVRNGASVDTSMGLTPLEGLVMGTRSGDLDPAVLTYLERVAGFDGPGLDDLLNTRSGLLGLSGRGDMRDVTEAAAAGDAAAQLALDVYLHRLTGYVGAYLAGLGGADAVVFTAGVGENSAVVRAGALAGLEGLGIQVSGERNAERSRVARRISTDASPVAVLVVPTDEELEIARQAISVVG